MPDINHYKITISTIALLIAGTGLSISVSADEAVIENCRESAKNKKARIACLEDAIRSLSGPEPLVSTQAQNSGASIISDDNTQPVNPPISPPIKIAGTERTSEPVTPQVTTQPQTQIAPSPDDTFGAEQVERREKRKLKKSDQKPDAVFNANIIKYRINNKGKLIVLLDNGQVWQQRGGDRTKVRLRDDDTYTAKISRGAVSGYRLNIPEIQRTLTVERLL